MHKSISICRMRAGSVLLGILAAAFILLASSSQTVLASHFRYGDVAWKDLGGNTIEFRIQMAWRRSAFGNPNVGATVSSGEFRWNFGDGANALFTLTVTSVDATNDWFFGVGTLQHTYVPGSDYTAFFQSCCRIGRTANFHVNNPNRTERLETIVNVGTIVPSNDSPVTSITPIVFCPIGSLCQFVVPGSDPDGDAINFRMSTAAEATVGPFAQPSSPLPAGPASIDPNTGIYSWDTTGATLAPNPSSNTLYSTQVMLEDLDAGSAVISKIPVDFLIQLVVDVGVAPVFDSPPSPVCGSTIPASVGGTVTFTMQASDVDAGQVVQLNAAGVPAGAALTPSLPVTGNPVSSDFSWSPTAADAGTNVITFDAIDNFLKQALCSVTIEVTTTIAVVIDIKPNSDPNSINRRNKGNIPVAILGSSGFDASTVDPDTVVFNGASVREKGGSALEDVNGDGNDDLVLHFNTQKVSLADDATDACVTGETFDGVPVEGCDAVRIVK